MLVKVVLEKYMAFSTGVLDYLVSDFLESKIKVGQLVEVPFQKTTYKALVIAIHPQKTEVDCSKLREINAILFFESLITEREILIAQEIADYYLCSLAKVLHLFLPNNIWKNKIHKPKNVFYFLEKNYEFFESKIRGKNQIILIDYLKKHGKTKADKFKNIPIVNANKNGEDKKEITLFL